MTHKLLLILLLALPIFSFDTKSEIAQLNQAIDRAHAVHDIDALAKLMTEDFHAISRNGELRDRKAALAFAKSLALPADFKIEVLKTTVYGDTVLQVKKESWSGSDGSKIQIYVNVVFVKQAGVWKLASSSSTNIPLAK